MIEPYQPTLYRLPEATSGRFEVLREFLRRFHGLDTGTVGRRVDRIDEAEARINHPLPLAVREWISLLDDLARINGWTRVLRDCWSLEQVPNNKAFSLLVAGEGDCHWGPLLRDLDQEDPPTYKFLPDYARSESRFKRSARVADRVSTWAIEFILSYLRLSWSVQVETRLSRPTLERACARLPDGVLTSQVGRNLLIEFPGGLIYAEQGAKDEYDLCCYAPWHEETNDGYHAAAHALRQRMNAMLGVVRI